MSEAFSADDHTLWYNYSKLSYSALGDEKSKSSTSNTNSINSNNAQSSDDNNSKSTDKNYENVKNELEKTWKDVAQI